MQTLNFNCSHCGKLMAVGMNLLGRNVRCPHCKQVVQAPATAGPPVQQVAPAPSQTELEPSFQLPLQPKESHESIFGEVHDDDVFGTRQPKVQMPVESAPPVQRVEQESTVELPFESARPQRMSDFPSTQVDPLPDFSPPASPLWQAPAHSSPRTAEPAETNNLSDTRRPFPPRERASEGGSGIFVWILLLYAAGASAAAAYFYFNRTTDQTNKEAAPGAHPFTAIPDFYGYYDKANRKEMVRPKGMPEAHLDVPENLRVALNSSLPIRAIEVTPLRIEYRDVVRYDKPAGTNQFQPRPLLKKLFLLHLRIKNTSDDVTLHPTDPAFNGVNRKYEPYTGIFVGGDRFLGGPWLWPDDQYDRQYIDGQQNDDKPLGPKEVREYVVASTIDTDKILNHLRTLKNGDTALWHVQLRSGLEPYQDRSASVTSVIGVPFTIADVPTAR